ncbi:hypothetical protein [Microbacterium aurum]
MLMNHHAGARRYSALTPDAVLEGAVVSFSGDTLVASGGRIIEEADLQLVDPDVQADPSRSRLLDGVPLLARGDAWIIPLMWNPLTEGQPVDGELSRRGSELWSSIRAWAEYAHGVPIIPDLEDPDLWSAYLRELVSTGARRADWWGSKDAALVLVVYGDPIPAPVRAMALHVVPIGWVSERRAPKRFPPMDLAWSWADAVEVAGGRCGGTG